MALMGPPPSLSAFERVSESLRAIGGLSVDEFLSSGEEPARPTNNAYNINLYPTLPPIQGSSSVASGSGPTTAKKANAPPPPAPEEAQTLARLHLAQLHHTCQRAFGQSSCLKFEFLEEGLEKKQCILTITRPDGAVRSYKSKPIHRRKNDAKAQAASVAVEHHALDFILHGDSDALKAKKGVLLAPLDAQPVASTSSDPQGAKRLVPESGAQMPRCKEIEDCCSEWRGLLVRPEWFDFEDARSWGNHGAVLRIQLAPHCARVYSCPPTFDSPSKARETVAELAIGEGVLEFIRHGNGQTAPQADTSSVPSERQSASGRTLQEFYEALPRPFDEPFENKTAAEINAPGYLSTVLANAKGARFTHEFYFVSETSDALPPRILQGCLLRLKCPGECTSYFADPQFHSQKDAKAAAALLALSQGAGTHIRAAGAAVEAKVSPEKRRFVLTSVFPALAAETQRISGVAPQFEYSTADDAFGCRLTVRVAPGAADADVRVYAVPPEYRSKTHAKIAVAYLAAEQGLIDLLRADGRPRASGVAPAFDFGQGVPEFTRKPKKRKKKRGAGEMGGGGGGGEQEGGPPAKKQKTAPAPAPQGQGRALSGGVLCGERRGDPPGRQQASTQAGPSHSHAAESRRRRSASLEEGEVLSDYEDGWELSMRSLLHPTPSAC